MLTKDLLKGQQGLQDLTNEQIDSIVRLSKNDEDSVISKKIEEIHSSYDKDIKEVVGKEKPHGVKTYTFLKEILHDLKKNTLDEDTKKELDILRGKRDEFEKGRGDKSQKVLELEQKLKDKESEYLAKIEDAKGKAKEYKNELDKLAQDTERMKFKTLAIESTSNLRLKEVIPESIYRRAFDIELDTAISKYKIDTIDENGKQIQVLRDKSTNDILRNANKELAPMSIGDYLVSKLGDFYDDSDRGGKGSGHPNRSNQSGSKFNLTSKNRVSAISEIQNYIIKDLGIKKTDPNFAEKQSEIYEESGARDLPMSSD